MEDDAGFGKASRLRRHRAGLGASATPYARNKPVAAPTALAHQPLLDNADGRSRLGTVLRAPLKAAAYVLTRVPLIGGYFGENSKAASPAAASPQAENGGEPGEDMAASPTPTEAEASLAGFAGGAPSPDPASPSLSRFLTPPAHLKSAEEAAAEDVNATPYDDVLALLRAGPLASGSPAPGALGSVRRRTMQPLGSAAGPHSSARRSSLNPAFPPSAGSRLGPAAGAGALVTRPFPAPLGAHAGAGPSPLAFRRRAAPELRAQEPFTFDPPRGRAPSVANGRAAPSPSAAAGPGAAVAPPPPGPPAQPARLAWTPMQRTCGATPSALGLKRRAGEDEGPGGDAWEADTISILDLQRRTRARGAGASTAGRTPYRPAVAPPGLGAAGTPGARGSATPELFPLLGGPASPWSGPARAQIASLSDPLGLPRATTETARRILATLDALDASLTPGSKGAGEGDEEALRAPPPSTSLNADGGLDEAGEARPQSRVAFGGVSFQPEVLEAGARARAPAKAHPSTAAMSSSLKPCGEGRGWTPQDSGRDTPASGRKAGAEAPAAQAGSQFGAEPLLGATGRDAQQGTSQTPDQPRTGGRETAPGATTAPPQANGAVAGPVYEFGRSRDAATERQVAAVVAAVGPAAAASTVPIFEFGVGDAGRKARAPPVGSSARPPSPPRPGMGAGGAAAAAVAEAARSPLPGDSSDEAEERASGPEHGAATAAAPAAPAANGGGGWGAAFLESNAAAAKAAAKAAEKAIEEQSRPAAGSGVPAAFSFGAPAASAGASSTSLVPAFKFGAAAGTEAAAKAGTEAAFSFGAAPSTASPATDKVAEAAPATSGSGGWGEALLKANKAASEAATAAVAKEIEESQGGGAHPATTTGSAPAFSFGVGSAGLASGSQPAAADSAPAASIPVAFSFGASASSSAAPAPASEVPASQTAPLAFSFGAPAAAASQDTAPAAASAPAPAFTFGATGTPPLFGAAASSPSPALGPSTGPTGFGSAPATSSAAGNTAPQAAVPFGASAGSAPAFGLFGASAPGAAPSAAEPAPFVFGAASAAASTEAVTSAPATSAALFGAGAAAPAAASASAGLGGLPSTTFGTAPSSASTFSFGGAAATPAAEGAAAAGSAPAPLFGAPSAGASVAAPGSFAFGAVATPAASSSTPTFGAGRTSSAPAADPGHTTFAFSAGGASSPALPAAFTFGAGGTSAPASSAAAPQAGFVFGATGGASSAAASPATSFGFGAAPSSAAASPATSFGFGGAGASSPSTTFTFGAAASSSAAAAPFAFGAGAPAASSAASSSGMTFGAGPAAAAPAAAPFTFGAPAAPVPAAPAASGFGFGAAPQQAGPAFGSQPEAGAGMGWGQTAAPQQANAFGQPQPNAFGQPQPNPFGQPQPNPFGQPAAAPGGFGAQPQQAMGAFGQAPDQQQGGFAFGAAQSAPAFGTNPQPAFGFGAVQQQPAQPGMGGEAVPNAFGGGMPGAFSLGSNSQSESARRRVKVKRNVRRG